MGKSSKASATPATDREIRATFAAGEWTTDDESLLPALQGGSYSKTKGYTPSESGLVRGRLSDRHREAFTAATGRPTYGEKVRVDLRTVEVPMFSAKTGRPVKPVVKTVTEVRAAAGIEGKAGRISQADMLKAAVAFGSGQPKAAPAKVTKPKASKPKA